MGRGYSFRVLRAKMLFGSQTAKRPLYRRISKYRFEEKEPYEANKYAVKFMSFSDIDDTDAEINRINIEFESYDGTVTLCSSIIGLSNNLMEIQTNIRELEGEVLTAENMQYCTIVVYE